MKRTYKSFMKSAHCISVIILFGILMTGSGKIIAQTGNKYPEIIQSTYYDAITLYFADHGYKAYPVYIGPGTVSVKIKTVVSEPAKSNSKKSSGAPTGANPGFGASATPASVATSSTPDSFTTKDSTFRLYKIIESATGKVILDSCTSGNLLTILNQNMFTSPAEQESFTDSVLARNSGTRGESHTDIMAAYAANTYLDSINKHVELKGFSPSSMLLNAYDDRIKENYSFKGGAIPSVTTLAEGLANFYIERVNQEINDAFFIHLQDELQKYPELKILFPKTLESLNKIEITKYNTSLNAIKSAYTEDIKNLLSNVSQLATLKKYQDLIKDHPELTLLFATCDMIDMINKNIVPAEILYEISNSDYITRTDTNNYNSSIRMAALVSNSLRDIKINDENKNEAQWVNQEKINYLKNNRALFRIFMGLLAQNAGNIIFESKQKVPFSLQQELFDKRDDVLAGQYIVYNFISTTNKIKDEIDAITGIQAKTHKKSDYVTAYIGVANEMIGFSETCLDILPANTSTLHVRNEVKKIKTEYIPVMQEANKILVKIEDKEYSTALYEADTLVNKLLVIKEGDLQRTVSATSTKSFKNGVSAQVNSLKGVNKSFLDYGLFIASVASAQTADDVKNAISVFALPKGSSRIKKEHNFSVGLNSYVGIYGSWNNQYPNVKMPKNETGITAPLGLSLNIGHIGKKRPGSLTLYGGIIDIGAVFTYKTSSDSTIKSEIQLSQIFSPSVGIIYGFPIIKKYNIPLSIGVSSQWGPRLQKVGEAGNSVLPLLAQRYNVFIAVDIPIVNFHVSKK